MQLNISRTGAKTAELGNEIDLLGVFARDISGLNLSPNKSLTFLHRVAAEDESLGHVGVHPPETDHSELHGCFSFPLLPNGIRQALQTANGIAAQINSQDAPPSLLQSGEIADRLCVDQLLEGIIRLRNRQMIARLIDDL